MSPWCFFLRSCSLLTSDADVTGHSIGPGFLARGHGAREQYALWVRFKTLPIPETTKRFFSFCYSVILWDGNAEFATGKICTACRAIGKPLPLHFFVSHRVFILGELFEFFLTCSHQKVCFFQVECCRFSLLYFVHFTINNCSGSDVFRWRAHFSFASSGVFFDGFV